MDNPFLLQLFLENKNITINNTDKNITDVNDLEEKSSNCILPFSNIKNDEYNENLKNKKKIIEGNLETKESNILNKKQETCTKESSSQKKNENKKKDKKNKKIENKTKEDKEIDNKGKKEVEKKIREHEDIEGENEYNNNFSYLTNIDKSFSSINKNKKQKDAEIYNYFTFKKDGKEGKKIENIKNEIKNKGKEKVKEREDIKQEGKNIENYINNNNNNIDNNKNKSDDINYEEEEDEVNDFLNDINACNFINTIKKTYLSKSKLHTEKLNENAINSFDIDIISSCDSYRDINSIDIFSDDNININSINDNNIEKDKNNIDDSYIFNSIISNHDEKKISLNSFYPYNLDSLKKQKNVLTNLYQETDKNKKNVKEKIKIVEEDDTLIEVKKSMEVFPVHISHNDGGCEYYIKMNDTLATIAETLNHDIPEQQRLNNNELKDINNKLSTLIDITHENAKKQDKIIELLTKLL